MSTIQSNKTRLMAFAGQSIWQMGAVLFAIAAFGLMLSASLMPARAAEEGAHIEKEKWTFSGPFGHYDRDQLRRGYLVYKNVCANCHGMKLMYYRNLDQPGGPEFTEAQVKAIAAEATVIDGPNDEGEMFERPGKPSDRFVSPFKNEKAAAAANNGTAPPDLSVMAKARGVHRHVAWFAEPLYWLKDIGSMYQEQGPDYIHALLTAYSDPPKDFKLSGSLNYNKVFPGHQIAMPAPLSDEIVDYPKGVPTTVDQYSKDVSAFLMWAAEPRLEERKKMGIKVIVYLIILSILLYLSKRVIWKRIKH